jgi:hypothetical protein
MIFVNAVSFSLPTRWEFLIVGETYTEELSACQGWVPLDVWLFRIGAGSEI